MSASIDNSRRTLFVPALGGLYAALHAASETILRAVAGIFLAIHGSHKITDPFGAAEMVEGLGFYPGAFWSLLLACTEFFGGVFIAIGLLTRPAAFAGMFVLLVTVWFHWVTMGQGFPAPKSRCCGRRSCSSSSSAAATANRSTHASAGRSEPAETEASATIDRPLPLTRNRL